jgi:hypothetical protein
MTPSALRTNAARMTRFRKRGGNPYLLSYVFPRLSSAECLVQTQRGPPMRFAGWGLQGWNRIVPEAFLTENPVGCIVSAYVRR